MTDIVGQLAACAGKVAFESAALAKQVARRRRKQGGREGEAYKCSFCRRWHIGKTYIRKKRIRPHDRSS